MNSPIPRLPIAAGVVAFVVLTVVRLIQSGSGTGPLAVVLAMAVAFSLALPIGAVVGAVQYFLWRSPEPQD